MKTAKKKAGKKKAGKRTKASKRSTRKRQSKTSRARRKKTSPAVRFFPDEAGSLETRIFPLAQHGLLSEAGRRAFAFHSMRVPVTVKEGLRVVKIHPGGRKEVLTTIPKHRIVFPPGVKVIDKF